MDDRILPGRHGSMAAPASDGETHVYGNLFAGLQGDVLHLAVFPEDDFAAFVQGKTRGDFVPILLDEHLDAGVAELLLVGSAQENDVAIDVYVAALEGDERGEIRGEHAFVVEGAAAPDVAVLDDATEGIHGPFSAVHADNIHVGDQQ